MLVLALVLANAFVPDSYGSPADVRKYCIVLNDELMGNGGKKARSIRHVVVAGNFAVATIHIGFDSFNVMSRREGNDWSDPYSVGPLYPRVDALTERGIPETTASKIFEALQKLDAVPPASRSNACS